jgi:hypothetical protein
MRLALVVIVALIGTAQAETIVIPPITHVKIDAQYYPAGTQNITAGDCAILAPGVLATSCRRSNNAAQQVSTAVMLVNPNYSPIYIDPEQDLIVENGVLHIASKTGDIICNGSVAAPVSNTIFANSFD